MDLLAKNRAYTCYFLLLLVGGFVGCGARNSDKRVSVPPASSALPSIPPSPLAKSTNPERSGPLAAESQVRPTLEDSLSASKKVNVGEAEVRLAAIASTDSVLNDQPNLASEAHQPSDSRDIRWLGDGYDVLKGARRGSCLELESMRYRSYPINQVSDTMEVAFSKEELAQKLNIPMNAEVSGTYQGVTFSPLLKANILRDTSVTSNALVAFASFVYLKDRISIYNSVPSLDPVPLAQLGEGKKEFREHCGDKFTRSIRTGAALFLIVRAEQMEESNHSSHDIQEAFKVGLGQLFGITQSVQLTTDQKSILSHFRLSTSCYSHGVSAHPCADNQLNFSGFTVTDASVFARVGAAKKALADAAMDTKVPAVLEEDLESYPVPPEYRASGSNQVFFDYKPYLAKIRDWMRLEERVLAICHSVFRDLSSDACIAANDSIGVELAACADLSDGSLDRCRSPGPNEFAETLDLANGGSVELWDRTKSRGRVLKLDLSSLLNRGSRMRANVLYTLHDDRFEFGDKLSSVTVSLKEGWQLILFEHEDGTGSKWVIRPHGTHTVDFPRWFNNKASSFMVKRAD